MYKGVLTVIQVTQAAIDKIKDEIEGMGEVLEKSYIRLHMGLG